MRVLFEARHTIRRGETVLLPAFATCCQSVVDNSGKSDRTTSPVAENSFSILLVALFAGWPNKLHLA